MAIPERAQTVPEAARLAPRGVVPIPAAPFRGHSVVRPCDGTSFYSDGTRWLMLPGYQPGPDAPQVAPMFNPEMYL
jgi:hypothetical protein